jgi:hypothetical protein
VRGLVKNWDALKQIDLSRYDLLIFNEIWQIRNFENISIPEFKIANIYQRERQKGGGVLIYIKENISYEKHEAPIVNGVVESIAISINNNIFLGLYRPPSGSKQAFMDTLINWISEQRNRNIYLAGDFNINFLNNDRNIYDSIEAATGLNPKISNVTRTASGSCIDNILTNINSTNKISTVCIADHQALISTLKLRVVRREQKKFKYREMKETNWSTFSNSVRELTITGESIDDKWSNLCENIKNIVNSSFPEKVSNHQYKFSMSQGLLKSKNKKK